MRTKQYLGIFSLFLATLTSFLSSCETKKFLPLNQSILEKKPAIPSNELLLKSHFIQKKVNATNLSELTKDTPQLLLQEFFAEKKCSQETENFIKNILSFPALPEQLLYHNGLQPNRKLIPEQIADYTPEQLENFYKGYKHLETLNLPARITQPCAQLFGYAIAAQLLKNKFLLEPREASLSIEDKQTSFKFKRLCNFQQEQNIPYVHLNNNPSIEGETVWKDIDVIDENISAGISKDGLFQVSNAKSQELLHDEMVKKLYQEDEFVALTTSPDKSLIALATKQGDIRLYNATNKDYHLKKRFISGADQKGSLPLIENLIFTKNGKNIFVSHAEKGFSLFSLDGSCITAQKGVCPLLLSNDTIIAIDKNDCITRYNGLTGEAIGAPLKFAITTISTLETSPKSGRLAIATETGNIFIYNATKGLSVPEKLQTDHKSITKIIFSADEKTLFIASTDGFIDEWDLANKKLITTHKIRVYKNSLWQSFLKLPLFKNADNDREIKKFCITELEEISDVELSNDELYLIILTNRALYIYDRVAKVVESSQLHHQGSLISWKFNPQKTQVALNSLVKKDDFEHSRVTFIDLFKKLTPQQYLALNILEFCKYRRQQVPLALSTDTNKPSNNQLQQLIGTLPSSIKTYFIKKKVLNLDQK